MTPSLMPTPKQQYFAIAGIPLVGGKIYTYAAGTTNPKATYSDAAGTVPQTNPIVLNARGEPANAIFWSGSYRVDVRDAAGNLIYSVDNYTDLASIVGAIISGFQLADYAALRAFNADQKAVYVTGYLAEAAPSGLAGNFVRDDSDTTSADDGGLCIIDALGRRWKRATNGFVDVRWFGAVEGGVVDAYAGIQAAIDVAASRGIYIVRAPGVFATSKTIILRGGVTLDGCATPGYYAGMQYYAMANGKTGPRGRIVAISAFTGGMIQTDDAAGNAFGFGLQNIILDANKMAEHCIMQIGSVLTERPTRLSNLLCQGATSDGIYAANILVLLWDKVFVSACQGFGVKFGYGVSDSQFNDLYIHTCDGGGMQIGDACSNLHFRGGKIEDNYANGLDVFDGGGGPPSMYLTDVSINTNNGHGINNNGGYIFGNGVTIFNHIAAGKAGVNCTAAVGGVFLDDGNIFNNDIHFKVSAGTVSIDGPDISDAVTANTQVIGGQLFVLNTKKVGIPAMCSVGSLRRTVGIAGASSASVTFPNALDGGFTASYFDMKAYLVTVTYAQYPQAPDPGQSFVGMLIAGKSGTDMGASIKTIAGASNDAFIAGVDGAISGNDVVITVRTGASWSNGSGHATAYVTISDVGHNFYK